MSKLLVGEGAAHLLRASVLFILLKTSFFFFFGLVVVGWENSWILLLFFWRTHFDVLFCQIPFLYIFFESIELDAIGAALPLLMTATLICFIFWESV